jgi:hypothetical protein
MHQRQQLAPGLGRPRSVAEVDQLVGDRLDSQPLGQRGGQQQASLRDGPRIIEAISTWSSTTWEDGIEKGSSGSGIVTAWQPSFSLVRGPFSSSAHHHRITDSVDRG